MTNVSTEYEMLAAEYYDPVRHPTCANFRSASKAILENWFRNLTRRGDACEVGCGKSLLAELLDQKGLPLKQVYLLDSAPAMLNYSSRWVASGAHLVVGDARDLPFGSEALDLCVSSLGDPYNEVAYWQEVSRTLVPGGYLMFTTPSHAWASRYRRHSEHTADFSKSEFTLMNGRRVCAPSIVLTEAAQIDLIENVKNLKVSEVRSFRFSQLSDDGVSHKLDVARDEDLPIVTGYLVQKLG